MKLYDDMSKFVHNAVSTARPHIGPLVNDFGEGVRVLAVAVPVKGRDLMKKTQKTIDDMDENTKAKLVLSAKCTAGAVIAIGGATVALPLVGFCTAGVKAGTLAAFAHGMIGNVAAGSTFAMLQSAGVLGLGAGTKVAIGLGGAFVVAAPWPWLPGNNHGGKRDDNPFAVVQRSGLLGFGTNMEFPLGSITAGKPWPWNLGPWQPGGINGGAAALALPIPRASLDNLIKIQSLGRDLMQNPP